MQCVFEGNSLKFAGVYGDIINAHDKNRRPYIGKPGSTYVAPNGDRRTYGNDGKPKRDYDHSDHGNPIQFFVL